MGMMSGIVLEYTECERKAQVELLSATDEIDTCYFHARCTDSPGHMETVHNPEVRSSRIQFSQLGNE